MLGQIIQTENIGPGRIGTLPPDDSVTFAWFARQRYIPMRQGRWSPAYRQTNGYAIEHYLISRFGDTPLRNINTFEIQVYLNQLSEKYSDSVVRQAFTNIRAVLRLARKQKYLDEDPAEDIVLPLTMFKEKPVMSREQILALLEAIQDLHDLCLLYVGIFCGPRASEVFGLQWNLGLETHSYLMAQRMKASSIRVDSRQGRAELRFPFRSRFATYWKLGGKRLRTLPRKRSSFRPLGGESKRAKQCHALARISCAHESGLLQNG